MSLIFCLIRTIFVAALLYVASVFFTVSFTDGGIALNKLSTNELEEIRQAAIVYLETKRSLKWEIHLDEIKRGAAFDMELLP